MRIAVYMRVSTDVQDTRSQDIAIQEWLAKRDVTSVVRFQDKQSGKKDDRPGLQALCAAVDAGEVDTVLVYRLDRLSRRAVTALRLLLDWLNRGVAFYAVDQPALTLGKENPLRLTIAAVFSDLAEMEREAIVGRVKAGLRSAKARGVKLGAKRKLNDAQREYAKAQLDTRTIRSIAKELNVSTATISRLQERA